MPTTTPTPSQERRKQILSRLHRWDYYAGAVVAGTSGAAHIARVHNTDEMGDYTDTFGALIAASPELYRALEDLLSAVTSKGAPDSRLPIAWSGSPHQNRQMFAAIDAARAAIRRAEGQE